MKRKRILAVIPARGGSKRIPRKNIKNFLGKPIIAYSIKAAIDSNIFDEVMVSTDDKEIARVAIKYGARVPFFRSIKSSGDFATIDNVMEEVLTKYKKEGKEYDYVFCIFPTAPFVTADKLKKAFRTIKNTNADAVVAITKFSYPIQRGLKIDDDGKIAMIWPKNMDTRSQDLTPSYHDAGQYFCKKTKVLLAKQKTFIENTVPIIIPETEVHDIDNKEDWRLAELKFSISKKGLNNKTHQIG